MNTIRSITVFVWLVCFVAIGSSAEPDFAKDVAPILNKYCVGCHAAEDAEADLVLESFDALLKGGENGSTINHDELESSLLLQRITDADEPMPPEDEPQPSADDVATLVAWVKAGAKRPAESVTRDPSAVFDKVAAAQGAKPITAIDYRAHGNIVILDDRAISGVDIVSAKQRLVPSADKDASPFMFFISNRPSQITYANLKKKTKVDGELQLSVQYTGANPKSDLTVNVGVGNKPVPTNIRIDESVAIGRFGAVELYDDLEELDDLDSSPTLQLQTPGKVHALRFTDDGKQLLVATGVAGMRGEAILWNVGDGTVVRRFKGHADAIYAIAISENGKFVATGSYDRQIIVWNAKTGSKLRELKGHNGAIYDLDFSADGKLLVSASADTTVKVWNAQTGERLDTLSQPLKEQYAVDISPDGKYVIAGGEDNRIRMWRLVSKLKPQINPLLEARFAHEGAIDEVLYNHDGSQIVSSSSDGTIKVWDAQKLSLLASYEKPKNSSNALAISKDDQRINIGTRDGSLESISLDIKDQEQGRTSQATVATTIVSDKEVQAYSENEPNDNSRSPQTIELPASISGKIHATAPDDPSAVDLSDVDQDVYQFEARAGEEWVVEVKASRDGSPLDSHVAVVNEQGEPIPRVQLQATRDSYFTFRGKDSNGTGDFRLHNWEEMKLNQFLYSSGEVVKLFHYPRGPDSGFNVYPNFGSRRGFFDTTPLAHALHEPAYIVEPYPPGADLPANGLPVFTLNYENDDDSQRRLGKDSRLTFTVPKDGKYCVVIRDVRGLQGEDFNYTLMIRPPAPSFKGKVLDSNLKVAAGTGKKFGIELERVDGFDGPVDVQIRNLPAGFSVPGPLQFEANHDRISAILLADDGAETPSDEDFEKVNVVLTGQVGDQKVRREIGSLGKIEVLDKAKLTVDLVPDHEATKGEASYPVVELKAGTSVTATIKVTRIDHDGRVEFGGEGAVWNAPHGVFADNIGLNGVLIVEGQDERQFFITAEPWVQPMERVIFVEAGPAHKPTSNPVLLRILPQEPEVNDQAAK